MARVEFAGDATYRLPKGKVEPYRLWFQYLKLAYRHPDIEVDRSLYADWGDMGDQEFSDWWASHWRALFATRAATTVIETELEYREAAKDPQVVVLRVFLAGTKKRRLADIETALKGIQASPGGAGRPSPSQPKYDLSTKRSMNLKTLRGMLRYLELYEANDWDLEKASVAYFKWASAWNEKVRSKKWKRPLVYMPPFLPTLVDEIAIRKATKRVGTKKKNNSETYDVYRNQARRFIRRGEKILKNVASGKFPGSF